MVEDKSKRILGFNEVRESFSTDESSIKASIQMVSTLVPSFEEIYRFKFKKKRAYQGSKRGQGRK